MSAPRIITAAERAARRNSNPIQTRPELESAPAVLWRKKGCTTCKPLIVPTKTEPSASPRLRGQ